MQTTNHPRVNLTVFADKSYVFMLLGCFAKRQGKINALFTEAGTDTCPTILLFKLKQAEGV